MADQRAAEQPDGGASETAVSQPHDKYFQRVFSNEQDAASLLRTCVPRSLADTLKWSTLTLLRGRFVADDWRRNETDLLYSVEREGTQTPVLVYVSCWSISRRRTSGCACGCSAIAYRCGSSGTGTMKMKSGCRCWCRWYSFRERGGGSTNGSSRNW